MVLTNKEAEDIINKLSYWNIPVEIHQNNKNSYIVNNSGVLSVKRTDSEGRREWGPGNISLKNLMMRELTGKTSNIYF